MTQIETGKPTPEPLLVKFLDLKPGDELNSRIKYMEISGKLTKVVKIAKVNFDTNESSIETATPEIIEEARVWLFSHSQPQGKELERLGAIHRNFLQILSKFDPK